jgi:hypothetical protein
LILHYPHLGSEFAFKSCVSHVNVLRYSKTDGVPLVRVLYQLTGTSPT